MINLSRVRYNIAVAGSVVALSLGALVTATPAQAQAQADSAPTIPDTADLTTGTLGVIEGAQPDTETPCPPARLCLYSGANLSGTVWHFGDDPRDNTWLYVGDAVNDRARSVYNNRTDWATIDASAGVDTTLWRCLAPQQRIQDNSITVYQDNKTLMFQQFAGGVLSGTNISAYLLSREGKCIHP